MCRWWISRPPFNKFEHRVAYGPNSNLAFFIIQQSKMNPFKRQVLLWTYLGLSIVTLSIIVISLSKLESFVGFFSSAVSSALVIFLIYIFSRWYDYVWSKDDFIFWAPLSKRWEFPLLTGTYYLYIGVDFLYHTPPSPILFGISAIGVSLYFWLFMGILGLLIQGCLRLVRYCFTRSIDHTGYRVLTAIEE